MSTLDISKIEKRSARYALLKRYAWMVHSLWYSHIAIIGKENILTGQAVIYAPNHRNALMDALAILFAIPGQPVFLARADMYRNKLAAKALTFLKIMPVYRMRDGIGEVHKNKEIFNKTMEVLKSGVPIIIFPEGSHGEPKRLRKLQKGLSRIAFQAEEEAGFGLGLKIVPVGIDYDHFRFRARLSVHFGDPIEMSDFIPAYHENPNKGMSDLRDAVRERLEKLMIHIDDEENYDEILGLVGLYPYRRRFIPFRNRLETDRFLARLLGEEKAGNRERWHKLLADFRLLNEKARSAGVSPTTIPMRLSRVGTPAYKLLLALAGLPFALYGVVNNLIGTVLALRTTRLFKDKQFVATAKFTFGLLLLPLIYLVQAGIVWIVFKEWWIALAYLLSLPLSLLFSFHYISFLTKQAWFSLKTLFQPGFFRKAKEVWSIREGVFDKLQEIEKGSRTSN